MLAYSQLSLSQIAMLSIFTGQSLNCGAILFETMIISLFFFAKLYLETIDLHPLQDSFGTIMTCCISLPILRLICSVYQENSMASLSLLCGEQEINITSSIKNKQIHLFIFFNIYSFLPNQQAWFIFVPIEQDFILL